jgi:hypothetical protein
MSVLRLFRSAVLPVQIIAALIMLASCATPDPNAGSGELTLHPQTMLDLERYMMVANAGAFAVSVDGHRSGSAVCGTDGCSGDEDRRALRYCEKASGNRACRILVRGHNLVWDGPVSYMPARYFGTRPTDLPVGLYWENRNGGPTKPIREWGFAHFLPNRDILLSFEPSAGYGHCVGSIDPRARPRATFGVFCTERDTVSGMVELRNGGHGGGFGTATDRYGNRIDIILVPHSPLRDTTITRLAIYPWGDPHSR